MKILGFILGFIGFQGRVVGFGSYRLVSML